MTTTDIILIIKETAQSIVVLIVAWTAFKVSLIEHSVNSSASAQVAKVDALTAQIVALTKNLTDERETAKLLAAQETAKILAGAGITDRPVQKRK